jgi:hypothetical protein
MPLSAELVEEVTGLDFQSETQKLISASQLRNQIDCVYDTKMDHLEKGHDPLLHLFDTVVACVEWTLRT